MAGDCVRAWTYVRGVDDDAAHKRQVETFRLDQLPALLRLDEVAAHLRVSLSTVERMVRRGDFAGGVVRFGRSVRIRRETLAVFLAERTPEPEKPPEPSARAVAAALEALREEKDQRT
jgi:excisionase family DNA binding protein